MFIERKNELPYSISLKLKIIKEFGFDLTLYSKVLDFGCGGGKSVSDLNANGYQSFGCDIKFKSEPEVDLESLVKNGIIRTIELNPYKLPFEDNTFDFIFSDDVFEHVRNYPETISELSRVLKPDGICLHTFASRYRPIETHLYIPLASVIQSYWWLYLWAFLGVGSKKQSEQALRAKTKIYFDYLKDNTNYLSKRRLKNFFRTYFSDVIFCEKEFLKFSQRGNDIFQLSKVMPCIPSLYSTFRMRVVLNRKPKKAKSSNSTL